MDFIRKASAYILIKINVYNFKTHKMANVSSIKL